MQVHFINVGYGESILVIGSDGFTILIDGGTDRDAEYQMPGCIRTSDYLRKIGIERLDLVIVTHIHDDHIGGIPKVIRDVPVSRIWINVKPDMPKMDLIERFESVKNGNLSGTLFRNALERYGELLELCERLDIPVEQKGGNDEIPALSGRMEIKILTPDQKMQMRILEDYRRLYSEENPDLAEAMFYQIDKEANRSSISLRIKAGKIAVLLSGDKVDEWERILDDYAGRLESQILKITHHGQIDGMPQAMIEVARPDIFVVCSSADRRFNSAHPEIISRARSYLDENRKRGGVYITGCLESEFTTEKQICGVCFDCNEITGEIVTRFQEI
jgi:competence protein ComEC